MSSIAEVFPHHDAVSRFVIAMSMARNDLRYAMERAAAANKADQPEFTYLTRLALAHYFDALDAVDNWSKVPEVKAFVGRLPQTGRDQLRLARSNRQKVGHLALEHTRKRTFHYPAPSSKHPQLDAELTSALREMGGEEVEVVQTGPGFYRLKFADDVALTIAMGRYKLGRFREDARLAQEGAAGFVNFATVVLSAYMRERGFDHGLPPPTWPES
jgi:hypothetical protein